MNRAVLSRLPVSIAFTALILAAFSACVAGVSEAQSNAALPGNSTATRAPFVTAPSFRLAYTTESVATADLDGDGRLDLVTADAVSGKVTVFPGTGAGTFGSGVDFETGAHPSAIAIADLSGSGRPEVVVGDAITGTVVVLKSLGNGKLTLAGTYNVGKGATLLATGDLNGDGKVDVVVTGGTGKSLAVLLNDGQGGLQRSLITTLQKSPASIVIADLNGDGHLDVALGNSDGTLSVLLGTGSGRMRAAADVSVGSGILSSVVVGDFDRDGKLDLAVTQSGGKKVSVLRGNGDGGFAAAEGYAVGNNPVSVVTADVDGDGIADLIVTNQGSNTFSVLGGVGDGTFRSAVEYVTGKGPMATVAGDWNGDGRLDLAIVNGGARTVSVPLGNGDGTFQAARSYAAELQPRSVASADLNGDGKADLVVTNFCGSDPACKQAGSVAVFLADENGTYQPGHTYALGAGPVAVTLVDVDGDKHADIVALNRGDRTVSVLLAKGDGSFQHPQTFSVADAPVAVAVGDFNHDGKPDLAVLEDCGAAPCSRAGSVDVLLGQGDGGFRSEGAYAVGNTPVALAVGDLNKDKNLDIVVADGSGKGSVLLGDKSGAFQAGAGIVLGLSASSIALGDLRGVGVLDLLVSRVADNSVAALAGNGDGTFKAPVAYKVGSTPGALAIADFDGDGQLDVAVANGEDATVSVLFGKGDGTLRAAPALPVGMGPESLIAVTNTGNRASLVTANGNRHAGAFGTDITVLANVHPEFGSATATVALTSSGSPSALNAAVTLSVTVSGTTQVPAGTVTFLSNGVSIADCGNPVELNSSGAASCTTKELLAGSDTLTATYSGDKEYAAGVSKNVAQTVTALPANVALTSSSATPSVGSAVTFTATVSASSILPIAPSGTVSFTINGVASSDCPAKAVVNGKATCTTSKLIAPSDAIVATYSDDLNFTAAAPGTLTQPVTALTATIALVSSAAAPSVDDSVTFTATVTPSVLTGVALSGKVSFTVNGVAISDCPAAALNGSNKAFCTTKTLIAPSDTIVATYSGDVNYTVANPAALTQPVNALAATLGITSSPATSNVGQSVTFTAALAAGSPLTVTPTGTVSFTINGLGSGDCPAVKVSAAGKATCTTSSLIVPADVIVATYSGDPNYTVAVPATYTQTVSTVGGQTTLSASPSTSSVNQAVTFTAKVKPTGANNSKVPTGSVSFTQAGNPIPLCPPATLTGNPATASCSYVFGAVIPAGVTISATYSGDSNFTAGSPGTVTQTVVASPTKIVVTSAPAPATVNQPVLFSATLTPTFIGTTVPTAGTVVFADTSATPSATLCTVSISATGVVPACSYTFTSAGTHNVTATYTSTDSNFSSSTSPKYPQTVIASGTSISITSAPAPSTVNQQVTFSSEVTSAASGTVKPQGKVTYTDMLANSTLCTVTLAGGVVPDCQATLLTAGTHTIVAKFTTSDGNFQSATSAVLNQIVSAGTTAVALTTSPSASVVNQAINFTATITPTPAGGTNPTGTVTFSYIENGTAIILCSKAQKVTTIGAVTSATCNAPLLAAGKLTISATYASGDTNFTAGPAATLGVTVGQGSATVAVATTRPSPSFVNQPVAFSATVTPTLSDANLTLPTGTVTFSDAAAGMLCTSTLAADGTVPSCSAALATAGAHSITAVYSGDTNFSASPTSAVFTQNVKPTTTAVVVTSSAPISTATQAVTYTATVSPTFTGTAPTGAVTFSLTQGTNAYSCTAGAVLPTAGAAPYVESCTITFSAAVSGAIAVTASYTGDANFVGSTSAAITQTVENFAPSITPTTLLLTQGETNSTDPFNKNNITLSASSISGFNDPLTVTSCTVTSPTGGPTTDVTCATTGNVNNGSGSIANVVLSATGAAQLGIYKVNIAVGDVNLPALSKQVSISVVSVLYQSVQLQTPSVGTVVATFDLASPLPSTSTLGCADVRIDNGDGTYGPAESLTDIGITCSAITAASTGTNAYTFTITAGKPTTTAQLATSTRIVTAAMIGVPMLFVLGLLPGVRKRRKMWLKYLGMITLVVAAMYSTGCGSGGFTRNNPVTAVSGSYVIEIQETPKSGQPTTVAVIPLLIGH